ncbi:hypothetical protein VDGL01_04774 [Verticillium dahliae]
MPTSPSATETQDSGAETVTPIAESPEAAVIEAAEILMSMSTGTQPATSPYSNPCIFYKRQDDGLYRLSTTKALQCIGRKSARTYNIDTLVGRDGQVFGINAACRSCCEVLHNGAFYLIDDESAIETTALFLLEEFRHMGPLSDREWDRLGSLAACDEGVEYETKGNSGRQSLRALLGLPSNDSPFILSLDADGKCVIVQSLT